MTNDTPTPLETLQTQHRRLLDRQAELSIEARALSARAALLQTELDDIATLARQYAVLITALNAPRQTSAPPAKPQRRPTTPRQQPPKEEPEPTT